jgi:hypothetical protein
VQTVSGFFNHSKGFGQNFQQSILKSFVFIQLQLVDLLKESVFLQNIQVWIFIYFGLNVSNLLVQIVNKLLNKGFEFIGFCPQLII